MIMILMVLLSPLCTPCSPCWPQTGSPGPPCCWRRRCRPSPSSLHRRGACVAGSTPRTAPQSSPPRRTKKGGKAGKTLTSVCFWRSLMLNFGSLCNWQKQTLGTSERKLHYSLCGGRVNECADLPIQFSFGRLQNRLLLWLTLQITKNLSLKNFLPPLPAKKKSHTLNGLNSVEAPLGPVVLMGGSQEAL